MTWTCGTGAGSRRRQTHRTCRRSRAGTSNSRYSTAVPRCAFVQASVPATRQDWAPRPEPTMQTLSLPAIALLFSLMGGESQAAPAAPLDWLAGQWCGGEGSERVEEHWMSPAKNGELLGLSRTLKDGRMASFEFLRIADVDGVPTYLAQPGGRPPTAFKRTD